MRAGIGVCAPRDDAAPIDLQPQVPVGDIAAGVGGDVLRLPPPDTKPVCGLREPRPLLRCGGRLHHDPRVAAPTRPLVEEPAVHEPDVERRPDAPADVELERLRESRPDAHTLVIRPAGPNTLRREAPYSRS